jgi:gamma-glutamyltranspeptidase/glutathione hydrolase
VGKRVVAKNGAVSSASPYASEVGIEVLQQGGNAVDAAVATAFALGVVEPQMSGLGGGGAMLIWLENEDRAEYLDFYAAQPAAAFRDHPGPSNDVTRDLQVVAVPGEVAGLLAAHERFGRLDRAVVLGPAIQLAQDGFPVNQVLAKMIASDSARLDGFAGMQLVYPEGVALPPGTRLRNPMLAESLRRVADRGVAGFYDGPTASAVVAAMNEGGHPVSLDQFADYEAQWKRPLCSMYRGRVVLSAPPPQTGIQILHTLELLERHDLHVLGMPTRSARAFDVMTSALRVGATVRAFNADPRWVNVHARGFVSEGYARERALLVGTGQVPETVETLSPAPFDDDPYPESCVRFEPWRGRETTGAADVVETRRYADLSWPVGADPAVQLAVGVDGGETTHISVVDGDGNAVSLSQTNSSTFGSGAFAAGFFLNNSGYRFDEEELEAPLAAEWRTRASTIAPTIVLEDGRAIMVVGAPGGGRIPTAIVQNMVYALDYGMDALEALRMPRIFPTPSDRSVQLEGGFSAAVLEEARTMGYEPTALSYGYARLYMIVRSGEHWVAVTDPRHDGEPRGR